MTTETAKRLQAAVLTWLAGSLFIAGAAAIALFMLRSLCTTLEALAKADSVTNARHGLLIAYVVISVGVLVGALCLLLRFVERARWDERKPPSLLPSIVLVGLGVLLASISVWRGA